MTIAEIVFFGTVAINYIKPFSGATEIEAIAACVIAVILIISLFK